MKQEEEISSKEHVGVVSDIQEETVSVMLERSPQCDSCGIKNACSVIEQGDKVLTIPKPKFKFDKGDQVKVSISSDGGLKATFIAYVLPFLIIMGMLIILLLFLPEWIAGIVALLSLIPYYFFINRKGGNLTKSLGITMEKIN
jgi:positive regulator of sigma E activity